MIDIAVSFLFKLGVLDPKLYIPDCEVMSIKSINGNMCSVASSYLFYVKLRVVVKTRVLCVSTGFFSS
jgi:hypothetical protein